MKINLKNHNQKTKQIITKILVDSDFDFEVEQFLTSKIVVKEWPLLKCAYGCDSFGKNWACPPGSPGPKEMKRIVKEYSKFLLVTGKTKNQVEQKKFMRSVLEFEKQLFLKNKYKVFALMPGPCQLCRKCTYPKECKHSDRLRPEMSGMGVDLFATLKKLKKKIKILDKSQEFNTYAIILLE